MTLVHYTSCPVCGATGIKDVFAVKDFAVSKKEFVVVTCNACSLRFTQDVPDESSISGYYKSENYISHTDTSKGLVNSLYKRVRHRTMKQKRKLVERVTGKKKGNLLDVGSGTGAFANEMKTKGWNITGLEPDTGAIKLAKDLYGLELQQAGHLFNLSPGTYDAITLWHVLEHVHRLHEYITQLKNLLADNGRLIVAVPNYTCYDEKVYQQYWAAYDVPRHLYHFSPKAMEILMDEHALKIIACKPMWYDSFYVSLLSSKYKNGATHWLAATGNGLVSNLKAIGDVKKCSSVVYIIGKDAIAL